MSLLSCRFGQDVKGDDDGHDSIEAVTPDLEELDLFEEVVIPKTADEVFDDFLYSYISSASFAQQRTAASVGELTMGVDDAAVMIYERDNDLVLQKDTSLQQVTVEEIDWDGNVIHNYRFGKRQGQWFLTAEDDD